MRKTKSLAAGLVLIASGCLTIQLPPSIEVALRDAGDAYNVLSFGAVPDGVTDNTEALQKALNAAGADGGGVVYAPTGRYSFDGSLTIPEEVTLHGSFAYAPSHAGIRDKGGQKPVYGTVLLPRANAGSEDCPPFITLKTNSVVQGVCIHYPDQDPKASEPTPYPYTIVMRGNNPAVIDVELLNPYNGIDASRNQRALIRNVHGQPIHIGVYVDNVYDIGRIENVHWNPWWSIGTPVYEWQMKNGIGFIFGRTDWHYVLNTFCFGYNIGYQFIETEKGVTNGNFLGIGADNCYTALEVQNSAPFGILITNGEFVSFEGPDPTMVRVADTNEGSVRFNNCAFWGPCNRIAVIDGSGVVGFSDCTFVQWAHREDETHALRIDGGSVLIRGCEFREDKRQVYLGPDVSRAVVSENLMTGEERVANESNGNVAIVNNVTKMK